MNLAMIFIIGVLTGAVIALVAKHLADHPRPDVWLMNPESEQGKPEGIMVFEFDKDGKN